MWTYFKHLKYYFGIAIEIIYAFIQALGHYIFSTTEKNIRNEIVLITGSGKGLGKKKIFILMFNLVSCLIS